MIPDKSFIGRPAPDADNPHRTILMFWPNSRSHGWADLVIRLQPNLDADEDSFWASYELNFWEGYVSYLSDTFSQFVDAFIALAEGRPEASAFADMEPARTEFRFSRKPDSEAIISLTILDWDPYRDEGDHLVYDESKQWTEFGTARDIALKHLMDDVLWLGKELEDRFGSEKYRSTWSFQFPAGKLRHLKKLRNAQA